MSESGFDLLAHPAAIAGIALLVMVQLGLMAWSIVDWVKRPSDLMRGNRIVWLIVIALGEIIGSVLYLTVARLPRPADGAVPGIDAGTASASVDELYGPRDGASLR